MKSVFDVIKSLLHRADTQTSAARLRDLAELGKVPQPVWNVLWLHYWDFPQG